MKTGYHAVYPNNFFEGIDDARKNRFDFVQFDLGVPRFFLNELTNENLRDIKAYADNNGVTITFHAPGDNVGLLCDYPIIRKGILEEFTLILEKANKLNARHGNLVLSEKLLFSFNKCLNYSVLINHKSLKFNNTKTTAL